MKILSEKKILKVSLRYKGGEQQETHNYLDDRFGVDKWRVIKEKQLVEDCEWFVMVEVEL